MKQIKTLAALCICAMIMLTGCTKYGTAVSTINDDYTYFNKQLSISARITDNGGCNYFMEQGFCYSLFCPPDLNDISTTQVLVSNHTDIDTFSATFTLPLQDTAYYVCAYVKNSAGLSYSNVKLISTNPEDYPNPEK